MNKQDKNVRRGGLVALAAVAGVLVAGCSAPSTAQMSAVPSPSPSSSVETPGLGDAELIPAVADMTVLVVGDSLARALGAGMSDVTDGRGVTVVNAAVGGCGIMLPIQQETGGKLDDPYYCNDWPELWPPLVDEYDPDAVYLTTSFWDQAKQVIDDTGVPMTFDDPAFQQRYAENVDRAIQMLGANGAQIYMDNWDREKNHGAQEQAVERNAAAGVPIHLVDLFHQVCTDTECPAVIDGINVKDETGHPAGESRDRQARFILNQMGEDRTPTS